MKDELTASRACERGSSTLEILIALVIVSLTMTAAVSVVFGNQTLGADTQINIEALYKAQAMLEDTRARARSDWQSVVSAASSVDNIYTKQVMVQDIDAVTKRATAMVSWTTGGRNLSVQLSTLLSDIANAGDTCMQMASGDWKHPQRHDFPTMDLISAATGNHTDGFAISDVQAYRHQLYAAAQSTANAGNTFFVFDEPDDPSHMPAYRGELDTAPTSHSPAVSALAVWGDYAFLASGTKANFASCTQSDKCAQLQVVDVSDPSSPRLVTNRKVPGVTGTGGQGIGRAIAIARGYVYLGLQTGGGHEFAVYDIGGGGAPASPANPVFKGSYAVGYTVNDIVVRGDYAYLATNDNSSSNKQLLVLDVSDKSNPHLATPPVGGYFKTPGIGYGRAVALAENAIYLGRTFAGSSVPNFYLLDGSNPALYPASYPVLGSKVVGTNDSVNALVVRNSLAFLLTNNQFQVWDVSDPSTVVPYSSDGTQNTFLSLAPIGGTGTAMSCDRNALYAAIATGASNQDILSVFTPS